ncbi:hypothetical protein [Nonomuraea gerenzanensis]|nr:hypothetical protein [Nonomuraea gerenzanensis]UBU11450.1 hypothetical protein LCN96_45220 [Nonomuraea gerenzanensis]
MTIPVSVLDAPAGASASQFWPYVLIACVAVAGLVVVGLRWRAGKADPESGSPQEDAWARPYLVLLVVAVTSLVFGAGTFAVTATTGLTGSEVAAFISAGTAVAMCIATVINNVKTIRATRRAATVGKDAPNPRTARECLALAYAEFAFRKKCPEWVQDRIDQYELRLWGIGVAGVELHALPADRRLLLAQLLTEAAELTGASGSGNLLARTLGYGSKQSRFARALRAYQAHVRRAFERLTVEADQPVQLMTSVPYRSYGNISAPLRQLVLPPEAGDGFAIHTIEGAGRTVNLMGGWHQGQVEMTIESLRRGLRAAVPDAPQPARKRHRRAAPPSGEPRKAG